ncbi:SPX domain-containing protein 1-like [Lycium barbarum]|uniref:SPX domain-containing protein 1-like n=1 Tax=Lycium ferocissimum TaxID=112874 RepID=UPI002815A68E|nr:SPX domain-containing protein 1-like [Lycium ferocissimum]XP_060208938.1 SPX domain-containing protein 1-like [Lycium barbarum]
MKFWKILKAHIEETLPEWQDKFLSYKDLKKELKLIYPQPKDGDNNRPKKRQRLDDDDGVTKEVNDFVKLLEEEIDKFNSFFVEKEEDYIIQLKVLKERVAEMRKSNEEVIRVGRDVVDLHGEMVLLENYSALNYTGLVKILKKYDKLSGELLRLPFIQKVLEEPFFETEVLNKLVKECDTLLSHLLYQTEPLRVREATEGNAGGSGERPVKVPEDLAEIKNMENMYFRLTCSALRVLQEIRSGSSTVSMFSLPPMKTNELDKVWKNTPVVEQVAK